MQYLSIMDYLRGQYVIYGLVRIILTEDEVNSQWFLEQVENVNIKHYIKHSSP